MSGLAGCATYTSTTPAARKEERLAAYNALSPEFKQSVDQGQLKAGMNEDAVYMVWGKPSQILSGGDASGETRTWVYQGTYFQSTHYWANDRFNDNYISSYTPMSYTKAQVTFSGGIVKEWQTFPHP